MPIQEHMVTIRMDESMWQLLNSYTEQLHRLVLSKNGHISAWQNRRMTRVVNAILLKFLTDNAGRIKNAERARKIRQVIRSIPDPELRAQASAAARTAFAAEPVRVGGTADRQPQEDAVRRTADG